MKKVIRKLRSVCGESLVETMAAVLIFTFSSIILLSMVATATKLNSTARQMDKAISSELYVAEAQNGSVSGTVTENGSISVKFTVNSREYTSSIPVISYSSGEDALYSFGKRLP